MCWQPGTPLLQGMTAHAASFLLKLLAKAFSGRDFPAARSDAEQPAVLAGRVTGASRHHLPARLHLPAGCRVAWDHAPAGPDGAVTSKYSEDNYAVVPAMALAPPAPSSLLVQGGQQIHCLGNEPPKRVGIVTMEIKKGFSAQLHQNIDLPPTVSQTTY